MKKHLCFTTMMIASCVALHAQHNHAPAQTQVEPLQFQGVLTQQLSDPELKNYKMESTLLTIIPGGTDTVSHRHDCELFGYVIEGSIDIALVTKQPKTYRTGEMFYEKRNILHTLARNPSQDKPVRVRLISIIKDGRQGYTPAYDKPGREIKN